MFTDAGQLKHADGRPGGCGPYQAVSGSAKIFPYKIGGRAAPCMAIAVYDSGAVGGGVPVRGIE